MALETADEVYEQVVKGLPREERLRLAERITREAGGEPTLRPRWRELRGRLPVDSLGEDPQEWVSRTRREGDESREQSWRRDR